MSLLRRILSLEKNTPGKQRLILDGYNGYGSTNTKIQRFDSIRINVGFSVTQSVADGDSVKVLESGWYALAFNGTTAGANAYGISINTSQLTTNIQSITSADIACYASSAGAVGFNASRTMFLNKYDIVRAHHAGSALTDNGTFLSIERVR